MSARRPAASGPPRTGEAGGPQDASVSPAAAPAADRRRRLQRALCTLSPAAVLAAALAILLGGVPPALAALGVLAAATLPGVALWVILRPTADRLEAVAAGMALGIPIMTLVFTGLDSLEIRSVWPVAVIGGAIGAGLIAANMSRRRRVRPAARRRVKPIGWLLLAATLAIAALMVLPPCLNAGGVTPDGRIGFVKNFGFDYLRHLANTVATVQGPLPPRNLFLDGKHVNSYWLYYPGPALLARTLGAGVETGRALLAYNFVLAALLLGLLTARVRKGWGGTFAAAGAIALFWAASSLRGVAQVVPAFDHLLESETRFVFTVPLFFAIFMGHHLLAALLLLVALDLYRPGSASATGAGAMLGGILLPFAGLISPFIGLVAAVWAGLVTLWAVTIRSGRARRRALGHAGLAILPGALGLAGYVAAFGAGFDPQKIKDMTIEWAPSVSGLVPNLILAALPLLFVAALGVTRRRLRSPSGVSAACLMLASAGVMCTILVKAGDVEATEHEVATKAGFTLLLGAVFFAGSGIARLRTGRIAPRALARGAAVIAVVLAAGGAATSAAYVKTYSDLRTARSISPAEDEACRWIRTHLPEDSKIIVATATDYGPKNYSFVAPLAERQVLRGTKGISYAETTFVRQTNELFRGDATVLRTWIRRDSTNDFFLFAGGAERLLNPDLFRTLDAMPDLLEPVWQGSDARIYRVRREEGGGRLRDREGPPPVRRAPARPADGATADGGSPPAEESAP